MVVGIWRIEKAYEEPFGFAGIARKAGHGSMFDDRVLVAKNGFWSLLATQWPL